MLILLFLVAAFALYRVLLLDPRCAQTRAKPLLLWFSIIVTTLPLIIRPESPVAPFSLCFALSSLFTPLFFSAMATEGVAAWVGDKVFLSASRFLVASVLAIPLSLFERGWWVGVLLGLGGALFLSRRGLWVRSGGSAGRYAVAVIGLCVVGAGLSAQTDSIKITPRNWFKSMEHLKEAAGSDTNREPVVKAKQTP